MADTCKIYKITNLVNGKLYIGQTWQPLQRRFTQHCSGSACIKLRRAIEKYGRENFHIELIDEVDNQSDADHLEDFWIRSYDAINVGYNIKEGGSHGRHSAETIKKMSELKLNLSDEARKNMSEAHIGYIMPEEQKRKISASNMGHEVSRETRSKISENQIGKTIPLEVREKISNTLSDKPRPERRILSDEQVIAVLKDTRSNRAMAKDYGVSYQTINRIKNGERKPDTGNTNE